MIHVIFNAECLNLRRDILTLLMVQITWIKISCDKKLRQTLLLYMFDYIIIYRINLLKIMDIYVNQIYKTYLIQYNYVKRCLFCILYVLELGLL